MWIDSTRLSMSYGVPDDELWKAVIREVLEGLGADSHLIFCVAEDHEIDNKSYQGH
jgi:hypothetical protein